MDFLKLLEPSDYLLAELFALSLFVLCLTVGVSISLQLLVDQVLPARNFALLEWVATGLVCVVVLKALLGYLRGVLQAYLARRIDTTLLGGFSEHLVGLAMRFYDTRQVGDVMARFGDAVKVRDVLAGAALLLLVDATTMLGSVGVLALYSMKLALFSLTVVPCAFLLLWIFRNRVRQAQRSVMERGALLQTHLVEVVSAAGVVKASHAEESVCGRGADRISRLLSALFRAHLWSNASAAVGEILTGLVLVAVVYQSARMALDGSLSPGSMVAVYAVLTFMLQPIVRVLGMSSAIQDAFVAAERLREVLDLRGEPGSGSTDRARVSQDPSIDLQGVCFGYGPRGNVLHDVTVRVPFGTTLAVVGTTGSGKSTLAKLLVRFYEATAGSIRIGGEDIAEFAPSALRRIVGYVDQVPALFNDTIEANLRLFDSSFSDRELSEAIDVVGLGGLLDSLPDGYRTVVGDRGLSLSGGQRQLLCLARALLRNPPVLILDEALSQLDVFTENRVRSRLAERRRGQTTIVITHRLSAAVRADRILVLEGGRVRQAGTHAELLRSGGLYEDFWRDQAQGESLEPAETSVSERSASVVGIG